MEMISSFIWFAAGAVLALAARFLINFKDDVDLTEETVSTLFMLIQGIAAEVRAAISLKHEAMKFSDIPDDVVKKITSEDIKNFKSWKINIIKLLLVSLPKKYYTYLEYKFNSTEEMVDHFSRIASKKRNKK